MIDLRETCKKYSNICNRLFNNGDSCDICDASKCSDMKYYLVNYESIDDVGHHFTDMAEVFEVKEEYKTPKERYDHIVSILFNRFNPDKNVTSQEETLKIIKTGEYRLSIKITDFKEIF